MSADFYDLLQVDEDADEEELKRAYRSAVRRYHPDVNDREDADAQFKVVKRAYETLSNPKERARYDRLGHRSYVRKHLGGLPTTVVSTVGDGESGGSATESGRNSTGSSTGSSRWDRSAGGSGRSSGGSATGSTTTGSTATGSTATDSTTAGSTTTRSTGTGPTASGSTTTGSTAAGSAASGSTASGSTASESTTTGSTATSSTTGSTTSRRTSRDVGPGARTGGAAGNGSEANAAGATGRRNGTDVGATARGTNGHATATGSAATGAGATGAAAAGEDWNGSEDAKSHGETAADAATTATTEDPHRVGLRRGLYFSLCGFLAYLVGLLAYLASNAGTLAGLATDATAAPGATLLSGTAFADPIAAVLTAPGTVPAVAFAVGVAALPLTVGTTVLRFGRGTARLYAVAVLAPTAWLLLASDVPFAAAGVVRPAALSGGLPVAATALLLVAIPVGATLAFVVDVGRYLRAR